MDRIRIKSDEEIVYELLLNEGLIKDYEDIKFISPINFSDCIVQLVDGTQYIVTYA